MKYVYKIILLALLTTVASIAKVPNHSNIDSIDIGLKECRLSINKSVRGALHFGETGTYTFNITNRGNDRCKGVIVRDMLPNNVQYTDTQGDWSCSASTTNPQVVQCSLSSLAPHASSQFSIHVTIPDQENAVGIGWRENNVTNCASVFIPVISPISIQPRSCVTTEVEEPIDNECRLAINKNVRGELQFGETGTYHFTITNTGNRPCRNIMVKDRLPNNVHYTTTPLANWICSASSTNPEIVQCTYSSTLAPYASSQFSIHVTIPDQEHAVGIGWRENNVTNCASVNIDDTPVSRASCVTTEVQVGGECRLSINKSVNGELHFGEAGTYTFNITNTGNAPCRSVIVSDRLPNNVQYTDTQGDWSCSASTMNPQVVHCALYSSLAPLASSQFSIHVTIPDQENAVGNGWRENNVTNCANVRPYHNPTPTLSPTAPQLDLSRSCVTTEVEQVDSGECRLSINKSVNGELHFGEAGEYLIEVSNISSHLCYGIYVQDTLPEGMTYSGPIFSEDWACQTNSNNPQTVTCHYQHDILNPGAVSTLLLPVEIPEEENAQGAGWGEENNVTNCASVYDVYDGSSLVQLYATDCTTTEVEQDSPECRLDINKSVNGTLHFGEAGEYLIEVSNISSDLCYGIYVQDTLPEGMTYSGPIFSEDWACQTNSNNPQTVTCHYQHDILNPGAVSTLLLPVEIPEEENAQGAGWDEENNVTNCASVYDVYDSRSLERLYATDCTTNGVADINNTQDRPFKLKVDTSIESYDNPNTQFQIPTNYDEYTYNYNVDCDSDGINEAEGVTGDYTCHYDIPGIYTISISGVFPQIEFLHDRPSSNRLDYTRVISLEQWGTIEWKSMRRSFLATINMVGNALDTPDLSSVENMDKMFYNSKFNQDISDWNVSHITSMRRMFVRSSFNENLSEWDVSNVTDMREMFSTTNFNQDISNWNTSHVTDMSFMFYLNGTFNQDIGDWNVSNVRTMKHMFSGSNYANVTTVFNQDISDWNVSNVTDMSWMFCSSTFNQDISDWNVSSVTNMSRMFSRATQFSGHDLSGWDVENVSNHILFLYQAGSGNTEPIWQ